MADIPQTLTPSSLAHACMRVCVCRRCCSILSFLFLFILYLFYISVLWDYTYGLLGLYPFRYGLLGLYPPLNSLSGVARLKLDQIRLKGGKRVVFRVVGRKVDNRVIGVDFTI